MIPRRESPADQGIQRHRNARIARIVSLLRQGPLPGEVLLQRLNGLMSEVGDPGIGLRNLQYDLEWMRVHLPELRLELVAGSRLETPPPTELRRYRRFFRIGEEDLVPIAADLHFVTDLELLALQTARAALAGASVGVDGAEGPLAAAITSLLGRLGITHPDPRMPDVMAVSVTATQPCDPNTLLAVLHALRAGDALSLRYRSVRRNDHAALIQPIILLYEDGELSVRCWDPETRILKTYKIARMREVARRPCLTGLPPNLAAQARADAAQSFHGMYTDQDRSRIQVRFAKEAVPFMAGRRLGAAQQVKELPDGGLRVAFNSRALPAVARWLLQFGDAVTAEEPPRLVAELRHLAEGILARHPASPRSG